MKFTKYMQNVAGFDEFWAFIHNRKGLSKLLPVTKFRKTKPRVCATCASGILRDGHFVCARPDGIKVYSSESEQWAHVCDRYSPDDNKQEATGGDRQKTHRRNVRGM